MARENVPIFALNAGVVSEKALARVDLEKLRLAGVIQKNLLPSVMGPSWFRPGTAYLDQILDDDDPKFLPFVFNAADKALIVIIENGIRVMVDGAFIVRPAVTTAITNGEFTTDLTGWTDADEVGATSSHGSGHLQLAGTGSNYAIRRQSVTTVETGVEHALRVVVTRGPVRFQVGTTSGGKDIFDTFLGTGTHSLAFTPAGNFHISVAANTVAARLVNSITLEAAGRLILPQPWSTDYRKLRHAQSGDILFIACKDRYQQQIERRNQRSWSIVDYQPLDGPFRSQNVDGGVTLSFSDVIGQVTVTANHPIFETGHVRSVWQIQHAAQTVSATLAGDGQATTDTPPGYIKVVGLGDIERTFSHRAEGIVDSTITLQRAFGTPDVWKDFKNYHADFDRTGHDGLDNEIVFYRMIIKPGNYGSDSVDVTLEYSGAIQKGVIRILNYNSPTEVIAEVVSPLGSTDATSKWAEGEWSTVRGFPSSVVFHDGRIVWGWKDRIYMSVSDGFNSFDPGTVGDSAPVIRSVAQGPIEGILWLLSLQYLMGGTAQFEVSMRGDNFGEGITPTKFTSKKFSTRGCADLAAMQVDGRGIFVQRNDRRVYEIVYSVDAQDYISAELTGLCPDICAADIVSIDVQRQPDTRVWFVLADGTARVLTYEREDKVIAWTTFETEGLIKEVGVLPGDDEDEVYFAVLREPDGGDIMAIERLARLVEAEGDAISKTVDSHIVYEGASTDTISGIDHLEGLDVKVWSNGTPLTGTFTVASGDVVLPAATPKAVVGLPYTGQFKSVKLAYVSGSGSALSRTKRVHKYGLLLANTTWDGIQAGGAFDKLYAIPQASPTTGDSMAAGAVIDLYDPILTPFGGGYGPDERFCLQISSPYCATIMGVALDIETTDGVVRNGPSD